MKTEHVTQKTNPRDAEKPASAVVLVAADELEASNLPETRDASERRIAEPTASLMQTPGADGGDSGGPKAGVGGLGL